MRAAPPVDYPVSRRGPWDLAACLLAGAAVGVPVGWIAWQLEAARMIGHSDAVMLSAGGLLPAVAAATLAWRRSALAARGSLRWDGQGWHEVEPSGRATELDRPATGIDLGGAVLLRVRLAGQRSARWLALERRSAPERWHSLRVALRRAEAAHEGPAAPAPIEGRQR